MQVISWIARDFDLHESFIFDLAKLAPPLIEEQTGGTEVHVDFGSPHLFIHQAWMPRAVGGWEAVRYKSGSEQHRTQRLCP